MGSKGNAEAIGQGIQTFSYKFWESNVQLVPVVNSKYYIIYLKVAKRVGLKCSHHTHTQKNGNYVR